MSSTNLVKKNLFTKPYLITTEELNQIGQDINLVGYDPQLNLTSDDTNVVLKYGIPCSPKLLNWVEPYQIAGIDYTLFYTEVNSGFSIGDRVFVINGTYDSNLLIANDKYKKGHDGYKVLFVDQCQVVLDIEFNGSLPSNEGVEPSDDYDNLVKVYYVKDRNDFIHVNRQITTRDGLTTGVIDYRFNKNQNNIIFTDNPNGYDITGPWGESLGLQDVGFYIKDGTSSWIRISDDFMAGSYSIATASGASNKIVILNNSFSYYGSDFNENSVYSYETIGTFSGWQVNVKHENKNVPLISKSNFRNGTFNGTWNGGIYGSNDKRIYWSSTSSLWNSGTLLNTIWEKGIMESKQSQPKSYVAEFDNIVGTFGAPYQKSTNPDNDGYGYNFVINSEIRNAIINNANVSNSILGGNGLGGILFSITEEHLKGTLTDQFITDHFNDTLVNKAYFESCGIQNANIQNSVVKNSRVENSRFYNVKSINTHYKKSLFKNSNYISDNAIRILHFEETDFSQDGTIPTHKVYKFYINKRSYEKFKFKDSFYIKGLKINNNSTSLLNFFDKKFKMGPYIDYVDQFDNSNKKWYKRGFEYNCTTSTPKENKYLSDVDITANSTNSNITTNEDPFGYSIDIFVSLNDIQGYTQTPYLYSNIIDYSDAYILNSDFESGIFENSNWNSGNHFNFSNDVNITYINSNNPSWYLGGNNGDVSNSGGYYDMSLDTGTSSLNIKTFYSYNPTIGNNYPEVEEDYLGVGEIVFLNAIDYDTRGKVTSITFSGTGSNYTNSSNIPTVYTGVGTGLTVDITASGIGEVTGFTISYIGSGVIPGIKPYATSTNQSGASGLILSMDSGIISTVSILSSGLGYVVGCTVSMLRSDYGPLDNDILTITSVNNGAVLSVNINYPGLGYTEGDILTIRQSSTASNATFSVTGVTGSLTRLPDQYKIVENTPQGNYKLKEIIATGSTSILPGLAENGKFSSYGANNRYGYLHKTKFYRSKIVSGIFKKAYFNTSLIKNELYDVSDRDFNNIEKIKVLLIVDSIFSGNSNILSKATYMNSFFTKNSLLCIKCAKADIWENGILYNSIWNGLTFTNGLVKSSTWLDGIFSNGLFYSSNTFDGNIENFSYNDNNINSFYKSGMTRVSNTSTGWNIKYNNRLSWQKGNFLNGEFYKSDWEGGNFNGGKFYYSKFYDGIINGGIIGDTSITTGYTTIYNGLINYTTVENAEFISQTNMILPIPSGGIVTNSGGGIILWKNGIFNGGIFSTLNNLNIATWSGGIFNGGDFTGTAKWLNGIFNGGKFTSYYNSHILSLYDSVSDIKDNYSWEYGVFNGGEFGNGDITNSSWFDGEFNGGYFKGKVWNNGVFTFGEFSGSGKTQSGYYATGGTESNSAQNFIVSFGNSGAVGSSITSYGIWKDGFVTDTKDRYVNRRIYSDLKRVSDTERNLKTALMRDIVWMSGTFSHPSGTLQNSVWLDGTFENGSFNSSSFNPYVTRNIFSQPLLGQTFSISDNCIWKNGTLVDSDFYISNWENGNFISGNGYGMIWKNGIVSYMNAYNIFWEDGLWKNGNWYGSNFNINNDGSITNDFAKQILFRGMNWGGTSSCHVWNVFLNESLSDVNSSIVSPANSISWQPSNNNIPSNTAPFWLSNNSFGLPSTLNPPVANTITIVYFDTGLSADRVDLDISVKTLLTSNINDLTPNAYWQISSNNINWTDVSTVTTTDNLYMFTGVGDSYFRIHDVDLVNSVSLVSNVLKHTQLSAAYTLNMSSQPAEPNNPYVVGTVTVNVAPATVVLDVFGGASSGNTTIGEIKVDSISIHTTAVAVQYQHIYYSVVLNTTGTHMITLIGTFTGNSGNYVRID